MIPIEDNQNNENNPNVVKDKAKQIVKKMAKRVGRKLLVILLPITIVLVLISAITWFVFMDEGTWNDKEKGNPSTYTKNVKISPTDGITTDKMELIKKALSALGYTDERIEEMDEAEIIKILQLSQKLNRVITKIDDCTVGELLWCVNNEYSKYLKKPEDLEYLLNAEVVTQYPNIDGLSEDKLNGIIKFARLGDNSDTNGDGVVNIYDIVDIESIRNRADIVNMQDAKEKNRKLKEEINKQIEASSFVLKYISESEFDTKFNNYINTGNKDVFNYFTIDDQENVIVATWSEEHGEFSSNNTALQNRKKIKAGHTESTIQSEYDSRYKVTASSTDNISAEYVTYTANKTPINYKSNVQKYTLPFEYLWSLLVMGESDDFVLSLAELAYESQMVVGIYDTVTTDIITNTHDYTENFREKEIETEDPGGTTETPWRNEDYSYTEVNKITTKTNTVQFDIMYASTWVVDVISDYKKVHTDEVHDPEITTVPDEDWSDNGSYTTHYSYTVGGVDPVTGEDDSETIHVTIEHIKEKKTTAQSYTTQQTMIYDRYEKVKTDVRGKDDIDPNTDLNFVKLLRSDQNANALLFKPINVVWLCDMLSQNADTVNMVELTEYLINKAKNPDDTSLSFDFSIFSPSDFNSINAHGGLDLLRQYIRHFEHASPPPTNADGTKYIIEEDGAGNPVVGYGVDIFNGGFADLFRQSGYSTEVGAEVDIEFVDALEEQGIEERLKSVRALTSGLNLKEYQIHALVSRAYNTAGQDAKGAITVKRGSPSMSFIDAYKTYWNEETDDQFEEKNSNANFSHKLYTQYMSEPTRSKGSILPGLITRRKSEWTLFQTGYYDTLGEWYVDGGAIIQYARAIHEYMENNSYTYCVHGANKYEECSQFGKTHGLSATFEASKSNKKTCCATFVSWVLQEAGYLSDSEHTDSASALNNILLSKGWQKVSLSDLEPGDVLYYSGHIEIYAGDGTVYNAGSGNAIRSASPQKKSISSALYGLRPNN